jgi:hypothetical protein
MTEREDLEAQLAVMVDDDARARRAAPLAFVCEVIAMLRDTPIDGFLKFWRAQVRSFPWWADDALACFELVLAAPPPDLRGRIFDACGFVLNHVTPTEVTPYSQDDMVAWLADLLAKMRAVHVDA